MVHNLPENFNISDFDVFHFVDNLLILIQIKYLEMSQVVDLFYNKQAPSKLCQRHTRESYLIFVFFCILTKILHPRTLKTPQKYLKIPLEK